MPHKKLAPKEIPMRTVFLFIALVLTQTACFAQEHTAGGTIDYGSHGSYSSPTPDYMTAPPALPTTLLTPVDNTYIKYYQYPTYSAPMPWGIPGRYYPSYQGGAPRVNYQYIW